MKMKAAVKELWLRALRSGEYKQGKGRLFPSKDTACCLGVLTHLYNKRFKKRDTGNFGEGLVLSNNVCAWAGLGNNDPVPAKTSLSNLNDHKKSFTYIANIIEKYL